MTANSENCGAKRFLYSGRWKFFSICVLFIFLAAAMLVRVALAQQLTFPLLILNAAILCLCFAAGFVYALSSAELLVDESGISRKLFGRTCQWIRWSDVKNIRQEHVRYQRASVIVIRIIGKSGTLWGFSTATTMTMTDRYDRFEKLVDSLNEQVTANAISVELKVNDIWQQERRIRYTIDERNIYL